MKSMSTIRRQLHILNRFRDTGKDTEGHRLSDSEIIHAFHASQALRWVLDEMRESPSREIEIFETVETR
jgi:hypothetical protein